MSETNTKTGEKAKAKTSIGIAVSFDGSSKNELMIVQVRTDGLEASVTRLVSITKDGMNYIRGHGWSKMYEISGAKEIVEAKENGND
mgnify:CR=1 FL=1